MTGSRDGAITRIEAFFALGVDKVVEEARRVVGDQPTYVSFDVDGLDPVFAPGTGTPEVGGYSTHEAQRMIRGLRGLDLVGADVVEVSPPFDPSGATALVGVTMMWELMYLLAEAVSRRHNQPKATARRRGRQTLSARAQRGIFRAQRTARRPPRSLAALGMTAVALGMTGPHPGHIHRPHPSTRSTTIAIPCPTPMHIVARP